MSRKPKEIVLALSEDERSTLSGLARSRPAAAHHVERAGILLHLAEGRSVSTTASELGIDRQRVTRCVRRVAAAGALGAIGDLPRAGRPPTITEAARAWLRGEACVKPKERGYPHELWTRRLLAEHARDRGVAAGHASLVRLAPSTVCTILNAPAIKPHKVRYYLERRDPAFERRMAEVIEVYGAAEMVRGLAPDERPVAIVSYDEKPGIQAIATTAPDLEPKPDTHPTVQRDHEYKRLGTVTLAAAVDLVTGIVHHAVTQRHRSREFVAFLQMLDAAYPLGILICVLLDNHSAHKSKETRGFLAQHPGRFELVFTPTHASWLNYVETYFSKMARSVLRQIRVASKEELTSRMRQYIQTANQRPVVPKWAYRINHDPQLVAT